MCLHYCLTHGERVRRYYLALNLDELLLANRLRMDDTKSGRDSDLRSVMQMTAKLRRIVFDGITSDGAATCSTRLLERSAIVRRLQLSFSGKSSIQKTVPRSWLRALLLLLDLLQSQSGSAADIAVFVGHGSLQGRDGVQG